MSELLRTLLIALLPVLLWPQSGRQAAAELYRQRKFREAAEVLQKHVREQPGDSAAHLLLGLSLQLSEQLPEAEQALREAVRLTPGNGRARYSLARVLYLRGRLTEAAAEAAAALKYGEEAARVHALTGRIRVEQRNYEGALAAFRAAMRTAQGTYVEPFIEAAAVLQKMAQPAEALKILDEALTRAPSSAEARQQKKAVLRALESAPPSAKANGPELRFNVIDLPFVLNNHATPQKHLVETMAGGVAVFDFDNDGLADIFFTNGAKVASMDKSGSPNRLFRNLGEFRFEDVTEGSGLSGTGYSIGAAAADYDGDGLVDLFVAGYRSSRLYRNVGDGRFRDATDTAVFSQAEWAVGAAWLDYDRDGRLDLFVINYLDWEPGKEPYCGDEAKGFRVYCHPKHFAGTRNRLYRNLGGGRFEDVSVQSGIAAAVGKGMSAAVADADGDGDIDIFVPCDGVPNLFFRNRGDGTFEEVALETGVALVEAGNAVSGMGSDFRDFDNDGRPDIVLTALAGETFPLFRNTGGTFAEFTNEARLAITTSWYSGWSTGLFDFDNDGWKDLFSANSHVTDNIEAFSQDVYRQQNTVFRNTAGRFDTPVKGGPKRAHRGAAFADFDNDGRIDIVVSALGEPAAVWRNVTPAGNWLALDVPPSTQVKIGSQLNHATSAVGYASSSHGPVHFGVGSQQEVDAEIRWPSGCVQVLRGLQANQRLRPVRQCQ